MQPAIVPRRRAVIYARYSSELQKERSIDDQVALCRQYALTNGFDVVEVYFDRAETSASMKGRDGALRMMADSRLGVFDAIIVEAIDRVSRDQEDLAGIFKRLSFQGVDLIAVHEGVADAMQIGFRGLMGSMFLSDLKHKVRRGMAGVVSDGKLAGGLAYGYDVILGRPGERTINEDQAAIVRRIFDMYLGGYTPRAIAKKLNDEGVPPPRGTKWNASTINGNKGRSYGILANHLYNGKIVWNRVRMVRDPDTGKRISRLNPESEWQFSDAAHLAIVSPEVFKAATARKSGRSHAYAAGGLTRRPKLLLSGLLRCSRCGGGMSVHDKYKGLRRVRCSRNSESGTCDNVGKYRLDRIEVAVFKGLSDMVSHPALTVEYMKTYTDARRASIDQATRDRASAEKRLADVTRKLDRLIDQIADGDVSGRQVKARMDELNAEQARLEAEVAKAAVAVPVLEVHPGAINSLQRTLKNVLARLKAGKEITDAGLLEAARALIAQIVIRDRAEGGFEVEILTYVSVITGDRVPNLGGAMVAGNRSALCFGIRMGIKAAKYTFEGVNLRDLAA